MSETEGRRAHERHTCELPVVLTYAETELRGVSVNVSLGGMFIKLAESVPYGTEGKLRLSLPAMQESTEVPVTVRWSTPEGVGVQFGSLRALEVWALNQLFKS